MAVQLVPRLSDPEKHREANARRVQEEEQMGPGSGHSSTKHFGGSRKPSFLAEPSQGLEPAVLLAVRYVVEAPPHALIFPRPKRISTRGSRGAQAARVQVIRVRFRQRLTLC